MPESPPQNDSFFPGPQIAPVGISDPTFSSRSDLRYVPTLRTLLHYKRFFIRRFGEPRLRFDLREKTSESREISLQFPGKCPRNFPGNFPGLSREIPPDLPGKFLRTFPGNVPGLTREISLDFPGKFPRTFPENFPGLSREISPDFPGKFSGVFSRGK